MMCIQCEQRPVWKPYSHYVCRDCYEHIMEARARCSCSCHQTSPFPAMCCTERHLVRCSSNPPETGSNVHQYDGPGSGSGG